MTGPAGRPPTRAVIFDLDGTLVQTRVASWEVFSRISERFELGVTRPEEYFDLFRGNVFASIRELCRDDDHAAEVKEAFLELLRSDYTRSSRGSSTSSVGSPRNARSRSCRPMRWRCCAGSW